MSRSDNNYPLLGYWILHLYVPLHFAAVLYRLPLPNSCVAYELSCGIKAFDSCNVDNLNPIETNLTFLQQLPRQFLKLQFKNLTLTNVDYRLLDHINVKRLFIMNSKSVQRMYMTNNPTLEELYLFNTQLKWIQFPENCTLRALIIVSSKLDKLPSSLTNLRQVTFIKIQQSRIRRLDLVVIQSCQMLATLDMRHNQIYSMTSSAIGERSRSLHIFSLTHNQLRIVNLEVLRPLRWVSLLDLSHNALELVVGMFSSNRLTDLVLSDNRLKALDFCQWRPMLKLTTISLASNRISHIPKCMNHLPKLTSINLKNNRLKTVSMDDFAELNDLQQLDLSMNQISLIIFNENRYPRQLRRLVLKGNRIAEPSILPGLPFSALDIEFQTDSPQSVSRNVTAIHRTLEIISQY